MYVPHLVCVEQSLLAALLQSSPEDPWVNALRADLENMKTRSERILSGVPPFSRDPPWRSLWRSLPGPWGELVAAVYKGVVESGTAEAPVPEEMGVLRSHAVRTHGKRDQLRRFVFSVECPACFRPEHVHFTIHDNKEFPMATESELESLDSELAQFWAKCRREGASG